MAAEERAGQRADFSGKGKSRSTDNSQGSGEESSARGGYGTLSSVFPSFSLSRYAQSRREKSTPLPPGVTTPTQLIKDSGPLQVEPKVWLANERTYLKWQHICFLLGGFAITLYNAAGDDNLRLGMGIAYLVVAFFAGAWGYYMHRTRRDMIVARSGKDFDNMIGPMVVSFALIIALVLNFAFKVTNILARSDQYRKLTIGQYRAAVERLEIPDHTNSTIFGIGEEAKIEL
jgi:uncharacterized membrane protein YidH (DUF202 family)